MPSAPMILPGYAPVDNRCDHRHQPAEGITWEDSQFIYVHSLDPPLWRGTLGKPTRPRPWLPVRVLP
jgi:hypothetical protein